MNKENVHVVKDQNLRTVLLIGEEKFKLLQDSHVLVVGLGGVGGYAVEQLCRAGIGELTIIDSDTISETNINRQIIATHSNIGESKVNAFSKRIKDINPDIKLNTIEEFFTEPEMVDLLGNNKYDYIVDAIDTIKPKVSFLKICSENNHRVVSSMGAGGKITPSAVTVSDISKTYNCYLARRLRKKLGRVGIKTGIKAVFSNEKTPKSAVVLEVSLNKISQVGTISYMPAIFGLVCASVVIRDITGVE